MNTSYMLDTNVFNRALDGNLSITPLPQTHLLVTGIQVAELGATLNQKRRADLLAVFKQVNPTKTLASSFAFDIDGAGFDEACWNDGTGRYQKMLDRLRQLDRKEKGANQIRDALIGETAIKNGATLVTCDRNLRQLVKEFGGSAVDDLHFQQAIQLS
jgi:predicted nucleic acid-binding protein